MNKIFLDTNIILDIMLVRQTFYEDAIKIFSLADTNSVQLYVSALTYVNANYSCAKINGEKASNEQVIKIKILLETVDLTDKIIEKSLNSSFQDFEDGTQYFSAIEAQCDMIITRNTKDFKESHIPVITPKEYLNSLQ